MYAKGGGATFLYLFSLSCILYTAAEPTIKWAEPVNGHWWDPLRWQDIATGHPRVPNENDEVVISGVFGKQFNVYLDPLQTGQESIIKSLTLGGNLNSSCCNGAGSPQCYSALYLRGASLTVQGEFRVESFGVLRFTADPRTDTHHISTLNATVTSISGWVQGTAKFVGTVDMMYDSQATMCVLNADGSLRSTYGTWEVNGTLSLNPYSSFRICALEAGRRGFEDITASQIKASTLELKQFDPLAKRIPVSGGCIYRSSQPYINLIYHQAASTTLTFFLYDILLGNTSDVSAFLLDQDLTATLTRESCIQDCDGDSSNVGGDFTEPGSSCSVSSSNSFGVLLGTGSNSASCSCPPSRSGSNCENYYCPGNPECSGRGACTVPEAGLVPICSCPKGWTGFACEIPVCPGEPACSNNGLCISQSVTTPFCRCDANWTGPAGQPNDCSVPVCSNNCTSPENGFCTDADSGVPHCQCNIGWALGADLDCSLPFRKCPGQSSECSGHGACNSTTGQCSCDSGWRGVDCSHTDCPGSPDCSHHGECVVNEGAVSCQCSAGWTAPDCSVAACLLGGTECSGNGKCVDEGLDPPRCVCAPGWTGEDCATPFSCDATRSFCAVSACVQNGTLNYCAECLEDWRGPDCSVPYCLSSSDYAAFPECSGHGSCVVSPEDKPTCECRSGWLSGPLNDCFAPACGASECSGHGQCSTDLASPACMCDAFFYGEACTIYDPPCPGYPDECTSGEQGTCVNGTCQCAAKWRGADCSIVRCPGLEENCNGRGYCNSTSDPARCECDDNWAGEDCSTPLCPGGCSGKGRCSDQSNPPVCLCSPFWGGPDCSVSQEGGSGSSGNDDSTTTYAIAGGVLGGLAGFLVLGTLVAYAVFKAVAAYKAYLIDKSLKVGKINFSSDGDVDDL